MKTVLRYLPMIALLALAAFVATHADAYAAGAVIGLGAVVNTKANIVANADSATYTPTLSTVKGGVLREQAATVEVAAADDDTSVYRFCRVPSNARMSSVLIANDVITAGTSYDIGVYRTAKDGGAVVDADQFASAVDLSSAHGFTENLYEAVATDISKVEKTLWDRLGLTADPQCEYDICLTANTVGTAAGTISMRIHYVLD